MWGPGAIATASTCVLKTDLVSSSDFSGDIIIIVCVSSTTLKQCNLDYLNPHDYLDHQINGNRGIFLCFTYLVYTVPLPKIIEFT